MPLARFDAPFEHPDWIFEPKLDGFRAVAYVEGGDCRLVSRNRNAFKTFEPLAQAVAQELAGRSAILDGEIVRPGLDGRPMFYELMRRRGPFCFYAFDLLWLDGSDLRDRPLLERKRLLRKLLPRRPKSVLYVEHAASGTELFQVICDRDMEGVVAKKASARYTPEATTWVKIKNRHYSQAAGRQDFFNLPKAQEQAASAYLGFSRALRCCFFDVHFFVLRTAIRHLRPGQILGNNNFLKRRPAGLWGRARPILENNPIVRPKIICNVCSRTRGELPPQSTQIRELRFSFALLEQIAMRTTRAAQRLAQQNSKSLSLFVALKALLFRVHNRHLRIVPLGHRPSVGRHGRSRS
jgi:hypothetical protein